VGTELKPEPAIPAILGAFDKYEVVAMPEDHGLKDLDDLIFALIRNPVFPEKVNDVVVECGNSLYQPILDRYITGEDVPLTEARKVWRNTTQPIYVASGASDFLSNSTPSCALSTRSCRPKSAFGCWPGILLSTGRRSRASGTPDVTGKG
jgi:hypothetical protein